MSDGEASPEASRSEVGVASEAALRARAALERMEASKRSPPAPEAADDPDSPTHVWARMSTRLGILAMGLCMAAPCTMTASYWLALPAAIVAVVMARAAYVGSKKDTPTRAYAKVGLVTSITALVFSVFYVVILAAYTALFVFAIVEG